jgi:hypothetical protein
MKELPREIKNGVAVCNLKDFLGRSAIDGVGNLSFNATIIYYHHSNKIETENLNVHIFLNGYEGNLIDIAEGKKLKSETHHLSFKPEFQEYNFDEINNIFSVSGESSKMGKYKVEFHV